MLRAGWRMTFFFLAVNGMFDILNEILRWFNLHILVKIRISLVDAPSISGWWFGTFGLFSIVYGMSSFPLTNIFQRGWNHQPVYGKKWFRDKIEKFLLLWYIYIMDFDTSRLKYVDFFCCRAVSLSCRCLLVCKTVFLLSSFCLP